MAKRRQMRPKVDINLEQPIHIDSDDSEPLKDDYRLPELKLRQSDKDILLSSTAWLTDSLLMRHKNCCIKPTRLCLVSRMLI